MRQLGRRAGWRSRARWWVAGTCITTVLVATDTGSGAVDALIVGKVVRCPDPVRIACPVVRNVLVEALDARHHVVAADAVANGHFGFVLKPGHYSLRAYASNGMTATRPVTATAHQTKDTKLVFHVGDFTNGPGGKRWTHRPAPSSSQLTARRTSRSRSR